MELIQDVEKIILNHFGTYLSTLFDYVSYASLEENTLEIQGKKEKTDAGYFIFLRMGINRANEEVYINNLFLPPPDRGKGIGLTVIAIVHDISKAINCNCVLADVVEGFRMKLLERGALETLEPDWLQIVDTTDLRPSTSR
jgi:hypothetical protein